MGRLTQEVAIQLLETPGKMWGLYYISLLSAGFFAAVFGMALQEALDGTVVKVESSDDE